VRALPSNGCFSASTFIALSKYATIIRVYPAGSSPELQVTWYSLSSDFVFWRRGGGVEPRVLIPVLVWCLSLCVRGLFQCNESVGIEKEPSIPEERKTSAIPNYRCLRPASCFYYIEPIPTVSAFSYYFSNFVQNKCGLFILKEWDWTWVRTKKLTSQEGGYNIFLEFPYFPLQCVYVYSLQLVYPSVNMCW
jgi:hypothetical protein